MLKRTRKYAMALLLLGFLKMEAAEAQYLGGSGAGMGAKVSEEDLSNSSKGGRMANDPAFSDGVLDAKDLSKGGNHADETAKNDSETEYNNFSKGGRGVGYSQEQLSNGAPYVGGFGAGEGEGRGLMAGDILPVELLFFNAALNGNQVDLKWKTLTEINNKEFEVQRASADNNFQVIGIVKGKGTTNIAQDYSLIDYAPLPTVSYYRLRQIDFDGAFAYSAVATVFRNKNASTVLSVFPNPTAEMVNLHFNTEEIGGLHIQVFNSSGKQVFQSEKKNNPSDDKLEILMGAWPAGTYLFKIQTESGLVFSEKVIKK